MNSKALALFSSLFLLAMTTVYSQGKKNKAGKEEMAASPGLPIKDFGLKDYIYLSKELPYRADSAWTLVCQLPHNAQFQPWIEVESPAGQVISLHSTNPMASWQQKVQTYTTTQGISSYEVPGWVSGEGALYKIPGGVTVRAAKFRETGYDTEFTGFFRCNDEDYNILWNKATRTCYLCMRDHFMDCPDRERTPLCLGDVCVQMEEIFYAFDTKAHLLAKNAILTNPNYTHIIDQNLAFAGESGTWFYYLNTGDLATIRTQYPNMKKYLDNWTIGENGVIVHYTKGWDWCDWGSPSKDKETTQCCQYYQALKALRKMAVVTGNLADLPEIDKKLKSISDNFDKVFWRGDFYQSKDVTYPDERANAMAVVSGLADSLKWDKIFNNVLSKKLNPNWEVGNTYNASSYFERWIMEALCMMGKEEFALLRMYDRYQDQINTRTTTLWEHFGRWWQTKFDPNSTLNHGWNSPNTILSRYIAGVAPEEAGWSTYHVLPKEAFLTSLKVVVPTVKGEVNVSMDKNAKAYSLNLVSPAKTTAIVGIPKSSFSSLTSVMVNGTIIWKGHFIKGIKEVVWNGEDDRYLKFKVEPGNWNFLAEGILPIVTPKAPRAADPVEVKLDKKKWKAFASETHAGPTLSYSLGKKSEGSANDAIDGDIWTCWSTGKSQTYGQWFSVDMGKPQTFNKIVLENGWSAYDFPRNYLVFVSDDGKNWGDPIATGRGGECMTKITFEPQTKRFIKLGQSGNHPYYWWSIYELDVFNQQIVE